MKTITQEDLVEMYYDELCHFVTAPGEAGGWPIKEENHHKELVKHIPALEIVDGRLQLSGKKFDANLLKWYWLRRYSEESQKLWTLENKIKQALED